MKTYFPLNLFKATYLKMAKFVKSWGLKFLGIWLVLQAVNQLFGLTFTNFHLLAGVIALLAGILLILGE